jgi:hypothetical protein
MRAQLRSSALATAQYHAATAQLMLAFHDGSQYRYSGVPLQLFLNLLGAPSQGSFFNREIRAKFAYDRIS